MYQISENYHTKEDGSKEEPLILKYNLDMKAHKQYQYMFQDVANTFILYWFTYYIYDLAPPDVGAWNHIKFWFGVYLYD